MADKKKETAEQTAPATTDQEVGTDVATEERAIVHIFPAGTRPSVNGGIADQPYFDHHDAKFEVKKMNVKDTGIWLWIWVTGEKMDAKYWFNGSELLALENSPCVEVDDDRYGVDESMTMTWVTGQDPVFRPVQ